MTARLAAPSLPMATLTPRPPPLAPPPQGGESALRSPGPRLRRGISRIGLVGPMSNYAAPPQLVEDVPYRDLDEMHAFARRWRDEHRGQWFTVPKLSGFCLLMKRAVYDAIGGLDERFGLGFFDDDDLAERARRAGFELAVAHDLFVHHFGSRTFAGNGIDAEALLDENARRFAAKWGLPRDQGPAGRAAAVVTVPALHGWRCGVTPGIGCGRAPRQTRSQSTFRSATRQRLPIADRGQTLSSDSPLPRSTGQGQPDHDRPGRGEEPSALPWIGAGALRRDRRRRYRQHRPHRRDRPVVRGEGVRLRLGRRLRRGPERGAGTRPAITPSGSMPTTWSIRPSGRSSRRCSTGLRGRASAAAYVGALRLRPEPRRQRRRDRRRSYPAVPAPRGRPLDLPRPRADPAGAAAGQGPGPLDRPDRPAHRLRRPRAAGQEARSRCQDPPARS